MNRFANLVEALEAAPPDRPFITFWIDEDRQETVTFGEFHRRAMLRAISLRAEGLQAEDRLVILMPQSIAAMEVFVAAMMLAAVPAFLPYPNNKVEPAKYRSGLAGVTTNLKAKFVVIDDKFPEGMLEYVALDGETRLLRAADGKSQVGTGSLTRPENSGQTVAFIQHSAGTTGLQKGVALTHSAVLRQIGHLEQVLGLDPVSDRIYSWLPLYHDMGLIACFMLPMVCHVPLVMQSPLDWVMHPETMLQVISAHRCTLAWLPNFAFQFVARRTRMDRFDAQPDLGCMRAFINCSEPVRDQSMEEFLHAFAPIGLKSTAMHTSYAMAENVFAITQSKADGSSHPTRLWADARKFRAAHRVVPVVGGVPGSLCLVSSGPLLADQTVRIIDEAGGEIPSGHVGEILVQSDCLFSGYYNRPDLTSRALIDGWYHTGDLGFSIDGELFVVGRKKDLIIVAGENIYPQDIEEIISAHPAIRDGRAVALGAYNPETGTEDILVVAECESEEHLEAAESIEQDLRDRLMKGMGLAVGAIYLKPPRWIVKSTAGKPARSATFEKLVREHPELSEEN